jgi:hypothetical protein
MLAPQDASNPDLTCVEALTNGVSDLCAVCNGYLVLPLPDIQRMLEPGSMMYIALYDNHDDSVSSINLRSAILIYLVLSISQSPDTADQIKAARRIRIRIEQQDLLPHSIVDPVFWILITDMNTLTLESPDRLWTVSRLLFVMDKLSESLRSRLDKWFYYKLTGRRHKIIIGDNSDLDGNERIDTLKSNPIDELDLPKILAAVWSEIGRYISKEVAGWKPPGTV